MPRPTREELNTEILSEAARLFSSQGYSHTKLEEIAQSMGYSKAALLYHFPSKEALLIAALDKPTSELESMLDQFEAMPPGPERDGLVVCELIELVLRHRDELLLLLGRGGMPPRGIFEKRREACTRRLMNLTIPEEVGLERRVAGALALAGVVEVASKMPDVSADDLRPVLRRTACDLFGVPEPTVSLKDLSPPTRHETTEGKED